MSYWVAVDNGYIECGQANRVLGIFTDVKKGNDILMKVTLRWNKHKQIWMLIDSTNRFVQEFFDCANVHKYFKGLHKVRDNRYTMIITKEKI